MTWKRVVSIVALWLIAGLVVSSCLLAGGGRADGQANPEGAVAVCNWENFTQYGHDGYNWRWVACNHTLHYHTQDRHGTGTPGHTVAFFKREARQFRAYCGID